MPHKIAVTGIIFSCLLMLTACGGGGADVQTTNVSVGQELTDLKKALDSGAISQEEYNDQREKILERD
jgi:hypothetical protein